MITKEQIPEMLLLALPSYKSRYKSYTEANYEADEERLIYVDAGDFVEYMLDCYEDNQTDEFAGLFAVIEQLHTNGADDVREFATVGILETIQNKSTDRNIDYYELESWLLPESKKWWDYLIDYWEGKTLYIGGPPKKTRRT
ncbi:hypothetical protein B9G55_06565 [Saccharibacillus sp. O16]|nr:hypothetical protein B9G55_06565 [Saccharibacillus sp. O16]